MDYPKQIVDFTNNFSLKTIAYFLFFAKDKDRAIFMIFYKGLWIIFFFL